MSFVEDVYLLYREQLVEEDEDAVNIVLSILQDQNLNQLMNLIEEMSEDEIIQMLGIYLVEMIKLRMIQDGKLPLSNPAQYSSRSH